MKRRDFFKTGMNSLSLPSLTFANSEIIRNKNSLLSRDISNKNIEKKK